MYTIRQKYGFTFDQKEEIMSVNTSVTDEEVLRQVRGRTSSPREVAQRLQTDVAYVESVLAKFFENGKVVRFVGNGGEFSYLR